MSSINLKKYLNLNNLVLLIINFFVFLSFLQFESSTLIKIIIIFFWIISLYLYFFKKQQEFLIFTLLYLVFYTSYSFYYHMNWSLWLVLIVLIIFLILTTYVFINSKNEEIMHFHQNNKNVLFFYYSLINLIIIEFFITLIPWPIDPKGKSIIILCVYYMIYGAIKLWNEKKFNISNLLIYLVVGIIIIFGIIVTSSWYSY